MVDVNRIRERAADWLGDVSAHASGKPAVVVRGQPWACSGLDMDHYVAEVEVVAGVCVVGLAPAGSVGVTVRARAADMLGLKEWRFLG
jgi:hypothetical protein